MRVLFLTSEFPYPPFGGAPLRNYGLIKGLAEEHEIWLLSFRSEVALPPEQTPLHTFCTAIETVPAPARTRGDRIRDLLAGHADIARRFDSEAFREKLDHWLASQRFDLIQIENLEMTIYLPTIKVRQPDTPVIYDAHNAEYALQQRIFETERRSLAHLPGALYSLVQARRVRAMERAVCNAVDHVIAVSDTDAEHLQRLKADTPITVVPNGISTDLYLQPVPDPVELEQPALVFTGKMDYRPNVDAALWFAEEILPLIRQEIANTHFYVVGQSPHPRLDVLRGQPGITITGLVPRVLPYLQAASIFVVPLRMGSGTRLKVLEAMAAHCAVVSTRIGAQGLGAEDGQELILADTTREFARAVIRLLKDPAQARALGANAQTFARERYDWQVLLPRLKDVYAEITRG
ncbi:MAG: glycosyltransferase [Anaerolineae bacterium]